MKTIVCLFFPYWHGTTEWGIKGVEPMTKNLIVKWTVPPDPVHRCWCAEIVRTVLLKLSHRDLPRLWLHKYVWKTILCLHAFSEGQGEIPSIPQFIWQDMCFEEVTFTFIKTKAPAVCCRETEKERQKKRLNHPNTTVRPSTNAHWWGRQTLPTGNAHLLPSNTSDISDLHHQSPSPPSMAPRS